MVAWNLELSTPLHKFPQRRELMERVRLAGGRLVLACQHIPWVSIDFPDSQLERVLDVPGVRSAEPCESCENCKAAFAPVAAQTLALVHADQAQAYTKGTGVTVAIIDTGVSAHQDLEGIPVLLESAIPGSGPLDDNGHGTGTLGILGGRHERYWGIVPGARFVSIKALDNRGQGEWSWVALGLDKTISEHPDVVVMALGGPTRSRMVDAALEALVQQGGTIVAAAGNSGQGRLDYPGSSPLCITVAAVDNEGHPPSWSNWAPWPESPDAAAPGVKVPVPALKGGYKGSSGTSMAAAIAGGCIALMYGARPELRGLKGKELVVEVRRRLQRTSSALLASRDKVGYGMVNALGLVGG